VRYFVWVNQLCLTAASVLYLGYTLRLTWPEAWAWLEGRWQALVDTIVGQVDRLLWLERWETLFGDVDG
jgi:hypothetical protein